MNRPYFDPSSIRTDLALEAHAALRGGAGVEIPGVKVDEERVGEATVTRVVIMSREAERLMGKMAGRYVTIEAPGLRPRNRDLQEEIAKVLARELIRMTGLGPHQEVLVVGLGNWNATPDALGPRVIGNLLVTRHLGNYVPAELKGQLRPVAAMAPGVLGLTGIETGEIIKGVVDRIRPDAVICVDALAAKSLDRIATTIQIADTGINPGSGVGNKRAGITEQNLGLPVYAIGVPTVVHASTIANDTLELLVDQLRGRNQFCEMISQIDGEDKRALIDEVLSPSVGDLVVTPKEIDALINDMSRVIAGGINSALHPGIGPEEISRYLT